MGHTTQHFAGQSNLTHPWHEEIVLQLPHLKKSRVGVGREAQFEVLGRLQLERVALLAIVACGDGVEVESHSCRALLRLAYIAHP